MASSSSAFERSASLFFSALYSRSFLASRALSRMTATTAARMIRIMIRLSGKNRMKRLNPDTRNTNPFKNRKMPTGSMRITDAMPMGSGGSMGMLT